MQLKTELSDQSTYELSLDKINPILNDISKESDRSAVNDFWCHATRYFGIIYGINNAIEDGSMSAEDAAETIIDETDVVLHEGKKMEDSLQGSGVVKNIKKLFRECGLPLGLKSEIVKHAFMKPNGYAGDYGLIEIVYNERILSKGIGYCADKRFLIDDYARAVRSRKNKMKEFLFQYLNGSNGPVEILNIACGSCREIKELFEEQDIGTSPAISFTLVDQDQEALDYSRSALSKSPAQVKYHFLRQSVYDYIREPDRYREMLYGKDLAYTIGLADYIPDQPLKGIISFLFSILKPGGKLVIAHKDSKNFSPLAPDWWCDWTFHLRDERQVVDLVKTSGIRDFNLRVERETNTNIIFFLIIEKQ